VRRALWLGLLLVFARTAAAAEPRRPEVHAPDWALWLGVRVGAIGFGNSFYGGPQAATTGDLAIAGVAFEANVGARLGRRHIPYLFYEQGFYAPGRKLDDGGALPTTRFFGLGFRYVALDPDRIGFVADVAFGWRTLAVYKGRERWELGAFEPFRLGVGVEARLHTRATISLLGWVSGSVMSGSSGSITFDGGTHPPYENGAAVTNQRAYLILGVGLAAHADLFGK
jgi:hypothetical protein